MLAAAAALRHGTTNHPSNAMSYKLDHLTRTATAPLEGAHRHQGTASSRRRLEYPKRTSVLFVTMSSRLESYRISKRPGRLISTHVFKATAPTVAHETLRQVMATSKPPLPSGVLGCISTLQRRRTASTMQNAPSAWKSSPSVLAWRVWSASVGSIEPASQPGSSSIPAGVQCINTMVLAFDAVSNWV